MSRFRDEFDAAFNKEAKRINNSARDQKTQSGINALMFQALFNLLGLFAEQVDDIKLRLSIIEHNLTALRKEEDE
jgi:hypothetical protein